MIDRHEIRSGQKVWALLNEADSVFSKLIPKEVLFDRLLPYQGFVYREAGASEIKETSKEAIFAETKAELIGYHVAKLGQKIDEIKKEQERLLSLIH